MTRWTTLLLLSLIMPGQVPAAKVYRCHDEAGGTLFQQIPCGGLVPEEDDAATRSHQRERHILWRLREKGVTLYLLGSIHFGNTRLYPLPPVMEEAFVAADALVVEVDTTALDPREAAGRMAAAGLYGEGGSLRRIVDDAAWRRLSRVAGRLGIPQELLAMQKPWFAAMNLAVAAIQASGYDSRWGVDRHFMEAAAAEGKSIIELEGLSTQLALMDGLPAAAQRAMLMESLREAEDGGDYFSELMDAWRRGDPAELARLVEAGFEGTPEGRVLYETFLARRNRAMADRLEQLMAKGGRYFVVVGAAHLVGPAGLVRQLRARGHRLEQL